MRIDGTGLAAFGRRLAARPDGTPPRLHWRAYETRTLWQGWPGETSACRRTGKIARSERRRGGYRRRHALSPFTHAPRQAQAGIAACGALIAKNRALTQTGRQFP